jgi:hypothetical protein
MAARVHEHLCYGEQIQEDDVGQQFRMRNTNYTFVARTEWQEALEIEVGGKKNIKRDLEEILCEGVDWIATYIAQNNLRWYWNFGLF